MQQNETPPVPIKPVIKKSSFSLVWLLPILTALIGIWLTVKTISEQGPEITVTFANAEGIEVGKTKIKYKSIDMGVVESIQFSEDASQIIITARLVNEAADFLRRDTRFWVVKPRMSLRGISGLNTLISGSYIEMAPGHGDPWKDFDGLNVAPTIKAEAEGKKITLMTNNLGSIEAGVPIYYQGIQAGEVLGYSLGNDNKNIFIDAFVKAPFDQLVNSSSRFWNISGVDVSIDSEGIKINSESMLSIMLGGIAFETASMVNQSELDPEGLVYTLYKSHQEIEDGIYTRKVLFVAFFEGSIRGLDVGAPVELKGIKVGKVKDIHLEFDLRDSSFRIPVVLEIEPERISALDEAGIMSPDKLLNTLIEKGLRAQLQTGSLLTGQLFVNLGIFPDSQATLLGYNKQYPEIPTIKGGMDQIGNSVTSILAKLEKVNLDKIGKDIEQILDGGNKLLNSPESDLKNSLQHLASLLETLDNENLDEILDYARHSLESLQTTIAHLNTMLDPDSPMQYRAIELSRDLSGMARSVQALVDMLERNPNAVIFGKGTSGGN